MTKRQRQLFLAYLKMIEQQQRAAAEYRYTVGDPIGVAMRLGAAGLAKRLREEYKGA